MKKLILLLLLTSCATPPPQPKPIQVEPIPAKGWVYENQDDNAYILRTYTVGKDSCRYGNMYKIVKTNIVNNFVTTQLDSEFYESCHPPIRKTQQIRINCKESEYAVDNNLMRSVNDDYALVKLFNTMCGNKFIQEPDIPAQLYGDGFLK